ncbi:hypothetical protein L249_6900 [Ophiocordyceps polyrhachis-furcata BCC 54312]|uniref:M-phase inducer phosphatase n=1 Tax=Ophiocordyceps polyrhachis-furcata BCC 54312 TaxID=1330021 RepID=A0A367LLG6_9HYPO|nr:hypothetical protein L249_6900 [Ophiocordyceps polyrhachis-furcata BCC 54312]
MEASSPLAALHRPMMPAPSWGGRDVFRSGPHPRYSSALREQLHKCGGPDYFNFKEVRGSSPAASLAADLSQNFRLDNDASPQFPTPRRALFTANMMSGMETRHMVTTPPLPSSSPGPTMELMEVSPLPHKTPFTTTHVIMASPAADVDEEEDEQAYDEDEDDGDNMVLDSPAPIEPSKPFVADRRIAAPRRPSLSRIKCLTTTAVPARSQPEAQPPTFRFGSEHGLSHASSSVSLSECFETASPPLDPRPQSANSPCPSVSMASRPRPLFASTAGSRHGSSLNCHIRRQSNPFLRNRKQFRRSLSMFETPADIMKPKPDGDEPASSSLKSVMDIEEIHEPRLPHFLPDDPSDTIPRVSKETLLDILDGKYAEQFDQKMIIDCRFEYEYDGGHIQGAVNHNDKELLATQLFHTPMSGRTLLIFHCEYSAHRAPLMARHIRSQDRTVNAEDYPRLTYPEVYILEGGYSGFFADHRSRCFPQEYVEMSDEKHQRTCEREMGRLKARKGLGRAQTFAFGQRESCINDSPTGPSRPGSRLASISTLGDSPPLSERSLTRRMASY